VNRKQLALWGLKFDPFLPEVPVEALRRTPAVEEFIWRIEARSVEGGFALVSGDVGAGKSAVLRILAARLQALRDVTVGILTRPQASLADFYRELGHLFGVALRPHNRWAGAIALREKWRAHIESTLSRPVLLVDEAQEMHTTVLSELRLLAAAELDAGSVLTVVLAGDGRLTERLATPDLVPLGSRIRTRLRLEGVPADELAECLRHLLGEAGNPGLMTQALVKTLAEHAMGNYRALVNMAGELLSAAARRELAQIDEKLYLEVFAPEGQAVRRRRSA
jgi:general secretion pathway protein A